MTWEYRLSWYTIDVHQAADMEAQHGSSVWKGLSDKKWKALQWQDQPTTIVYTEYNNQAQTDQYFTLREWAKTHEQPIRDVKLERRNISPTEWEDVSP